jgi:predicted membrane chloride channel (bestrophin family)
MSQSDKPAGDDPETARVPPTSGVWAAIALSIAFCLFLGSSLSDQLRALDALSKLDAQQTSTLATSNKAEDQLTALAKGLQQLSDQGNANANAVIAVLHRNGVNIKGGR